MKLPDAEVCHITKGRVRIKIPSKKGNKSFFDELRNTLINDGFAKEVSINPSISSFILYTEENLDNIKTYAREKNLFELKTIDEEKRKVINYTIKQAYNNLDSKLKRFFNNEIDLGSTVFLTLIG
ncbi:MAG: hypothetical protein N2202_03575, partial [Proteobacteria bacterium]|nr:hypothetical protein [Pseudomonadota bacterium]